MAPVQTQCESRELFDNYGVLNLFVALLQNYNRVMVLTDLKKELMTDKASFRAIIEQ